jgi:hypothetical protein
MLESVCHQIIQNPRFQADYQAISHQSVIASTGIYGAPALEEEAIRRLMQSAALFAQSSEPDWRQMAYRISIGSLAYRELLGGIEEAVRLTFARLGNYPAIKFAFSGTPEPATMPPRVFYEISGRRNENTILVGDRPTVLTDMQKAVWDVISTGASLALSAPTSAGKSYVLSAYIEHLKRSQSESVIVYLVPSRALISQVSEDLRSGADENLFEVATVPILVEEGNPIYVLTPERLQVLFNVAPDLSFDVAIIDEAHLIGEGSRGIVLHSVLQDLQARNSDVQFLFSSPQVRDPGVFGSVVGQENIKVIKTKDTPVAQNILLLKGDALDSQRIDLFLWEAGEQMRLSEIQLPLPLYNSLDRLIYLSWALGAGSQSLVYAEGPASCENIALRIKDLFHDETVNPAGWRDPLLDEVARARAALANFAKEAVHSTYVLADAVQNGIGFHYGRIPTLLRNAVEDAFSFGYLDYIVCTSTLLQGVNLPARNIFMQNPHKGAEQPIDPVDFWNLAGRAGRLGKDFQGNVFLIDYDEWESAPLSGPKDEPVKPALESTLLELSAEFLEYVVSEDRPSGESPLLEAAFSKLIRDYRHGRLDETLTRIEGLSPEMRTQVEKTVASVDDQIEVDLETLDESPQISGYRQQELYRYMMQKVAEKGPEYLIPVHPSANWTEALNKLRPIFARVHKYLELKSGNHHRYWAPLALRWMRGEPLPKIIDEAIKYHKSQGKSRSNRTVIRDVLTDVESDLRFRYVNLLGCYTSVLKQALKDSHYGDYIPRVPALTLYLELGAASQTMIHLMGLGLSRHTANVVSRESINKEMDARAAKAFLRRVDPEAIGLSPYLVSEVNRVKAGL